MVTKQLKKTDSLYSATKNHKDSKQQAGDTLAVLPGNTICLFVLFVLNVIHKFMTSLTSYLKAKGMKLLYYNIVEKGKHPNAAISTII